MKMMTFKNIFYLSLIFHLLAAILSSGFHHFDEHFQIFEFLNLKLGGTTSADLSWEFRERIRPWFQPYIYLSIHYVLTALGLKSPFMMAIFFRLITSLFGLFSIYKLLPVIRNWFDSKKEQFIAWALLNLLWFVPYIQARTSSESLAISFFFLGISFFLRKQNTENVLKNTFLAGLFFGCSYLARSQMAFCVAFLWLWALLIDKRPTKELGLFATAIILLNILGVGLDSLGYGEFTVSIWHYYRTNFQEGIITSLRQYPIYWYFYWAFNRGIPPVSFFLIIATVVGWWKYRKHALTWCTLPLFIFHSLVGHKELRFIFPIVMLSPLFMALLYRDYRLRIDNFLNRKFGKFIFKFVLTINMIFLCISSLRPANPAVNFYKYIYYNKKIEKIYAHNENPLTMLGLPLNFYKKENFSVQVFKNFNELSFDKEKYVFFRKGKDIVEMEKNQNCQLKYMTYPRWSLDFNIGNWLSRSRVWSLFLCRPKI